MLWGHARDAVIAAGLTGPDGQPLRVVAHQLRHTWATELEMSGVAVEASFDTLSDRCPVWELGSPPVTLAG